MPAMKPQMLVYKTRYEEVAVVVAIPKVQLQWVIADAGRGLKRLGLKLFRQKIIRIALIDQSRNELPCLAHQQAGVVFGPACGVFAKIGSEGFLAPGTVDGVADRAEGRYGLESFRVAQSQNQGAVTTH